MRKVKFLAILTISFGSVMLLLSFNTTKDNKDKTVVTFPKVKISLISGLPDKKNILDYAVDTINSLVYCVANHPDNAPDDFALVSKSAKDYKRQDLTLYKLQDNNWIKVGDEFKSYGEQSLFTFEGKVYWSVQHKVSIINNEKVAMSDVFLLNKDGIEKQYQNIRGSVFGFIRYKGELYIYGNFWPEGISKDKKCGLMKSKGDIFIPIFCDNAVSKYYPYSIASFLHAVEFNDKLYFTGSIHLKTDAGPNATNIISWDGSKWMPLGIDFDLYEKITKIHVYQDRLYVGGVFYSSSKKSIPINNIFSIDKNGRIDNLKTGFSFRGQSEVAYLTRVDVFNNKLLFAGGFVKAGNDKLIHDLAFWDGSEFSPIIQKCAGPPTRFYGAIPYSSNKLLVFGRFQEINDIKVTQHAWIELQD